MSFRKWVSPIHTCSAPLPDALPRAYLTDDQASPFPVETLVEEKKQGPRCHVVIERTRAKDQPPFGLGNKFFTTLPLFSTFLSYHFWGLLVG